MHRLEHSDGGILDRDDVLCDVADDKDRVSVGSWSFHLQSWWDLRGKNCTSREWQKSRINSSLNW